MQKKRESGGRRAPRLAGELPGTPVSPGPGPGTVVDLSPTGFPVLFLQDGPRCVAYCYYMLDGGRAIVGSVFACDDFRGKRFEEALLREVLAEAQGHEGHERVECQTLFSTAAAADELFARAGFQS